MFQNDTYVQLLENKRYIYIPIENKLMLAETDGEV